MSKRRSRVATLRWLRLNANVCAGVRLIERTDTRSGGIGTEHRMPSPQKKTRKPGRGRQKCAYRSRPGTVGIISRRGATVGSEECHLRINILIL